jgi:putative redox protein
MAKTPVRLTLTWDHDLAFRAQLPDGRELLTDGNGARGFSPVDLLAAAIAGCMAADIVHILRKGRQPIAGLRTTLEGRRAESDPHRFVQVTIAFVASGAVDPRQLGRAVQLSRDVYCSVWNSLRTDIILETSTRVEP